MDVGAKGIEITVPIDASEVVQMTPAKLDAGRSTNGGFSQKQLVSLGVLLRTNEKRARGWEKRWSNLRVQRWRYDEFVAHKDGHLTADGTHKWRHGKRGPRHAAVAQDVIALRDELRLLRQRVRALEVTNEPLTSTDR